MIGVFDSGLGGLTVLKALDERFPELSFVYLGDHANVPYGERASSEIVELTRAGVERLYGLGCGLVLLGCNTATAIAARSLQQGWLPQAGEWQGRNLLGIVAPTVEAATQTPWAVTQPQYPQKFNSDLIVVFGTPRTIASNVYPEEISKRCPNVQVVQQACPGLAGAIEEGADDDMLESMVVEACAAALGRCEGRRPDRFILGCTHYPIVADLFARHLPHGVRMLSQPATVADSLEDYLERHPRYRASPPGAGRRLTLMTTGDARRVTDAARRFWSSAPDMIGA